MLAKNPIIPMDVQKCYAGESKPKLIKSRLNGPGKVKKPSMIGVQFMGDLFHESIPDNMIDRVFSTITSDSCYPLHGLFNADKHTYLILTKRIERILAGNPEHFARWKNIWLGVTVEHPDYLWRIDELLKIPAAVRFVSIEPMLEGINIKEYLPVPIMKPFRPDHFLTNLRTNVLDWIILGAETGPGARPMQLEWAKEVRDHCRKGGIPFFFKSAGNKIETPKDLLIREFPGESLYRCPNCGDRILKPGHCHNPYCKLRR